LNVGQIKPIDRHPAKSDEDCSPEHISDTENWLNWSGDLNIPNARDDDWEADNESDMELNNGNEDSETPEQQNVSATPNVPRLIRPILQSKMMVEHSLIMVNIMETMRNKGIKNK
jgi:hypothetical protein